MPAYSKCTVVQLRDLCESRGIDHQGLLKNQLIKALCADDFSAPADADDNGEMMPVEDIVSGGSESPEIHDLFSEVGESPTHQVISEALRLKLIELEIEKTKLEQCKLQPSTPQERVGFRPRDAHLPVIADSGDPLAFFACFEKTLQLNGVSVSDYAKLLSSHLNEHAKRVFAFCRMSNVWITASLNRRLLPVSELPQARSYLDKFRSIRRSGTENQKMFVGRLTETFSYYLEAGELKTLNDLKEAVILELFFATLDGTTKQFVKNNCPKNSLEAAQLADLYFENRTTSQKFPVSNRNKAPNVETENRATSNVVKDTNKSATPQAARKEFARSKNACFI